MAKRSLIIVDDFYDDPYGVRETALAMEYPTSGRFPGRNTANYEIEATLRRVSGILRMPVICDLRNRDITFFRLTRGSDVGSCDVHVDFSGWAGVCYLNPDPPTEGGTSFFRHQRTGLTRWPSEEEIRELCIEGIIADGDDSPTEAASRYFTDESHRRDAWEEIMHMPNRFNRAVFYDAKQFHTIREWSRFGDDPETARMTQLFFFNEKVA